MTKVYVLRQTPKPWIPAALAAGLFVALTSCAFTLRWWFSLDGIGTAFTLLWCMIAYVLIAAPEVWRAIKSSPFNAIETPVPPEHVPWALQFYTYAKRRLPTMEIPKAIDAYAQAKAEHRAPKTNGSNPELEDAIQQVQESGHERANLNV